MSKKSSIKISDLKGLIGITTDATVGITDLVEDMNKRIVHPPFLPSTPIQHLITGISGIVYSGVRNTTKFIGGGLEKITNHFDQQFDIGLSFGKKETMLAVLNGVVGDYLSKKKNPLAIPMQLRYQGETIALDADNINKVYPKINGNILLMVHGLCMNDLQWNQNGHNHGELLAQEFGLIPIYVQYNGGLHVSENGQNFNAILEKLLKAWPVAIDEITIVAHSMGGLVTRSAFNYGKKENKNWTKHVKKLVFLGSPHHGAPLERIGNYIDHLFEAISYVKPFARLSKMRSSGITDLRFGNLLKEDWKGQDRFKNSSKERKHVALPENVTSYAIAACIGKEEGTLKTTILGDGLVQLDSALGQHKDPNRTLNFKESNTYISYETSHMELLSNIKVYNKLKEWLVK
jgi:pimeloyl-ACP methyl ester carboxylesterase